MLTETFIVAPEIGPEREKALWQAGFSNWWDVRQASEGDLPAGIPGAFLRQAMEWSIQAFQDEDWPALAQLLKSTNHWRALQLATSGELCSRPPLRVLALDIETEGISKYENRVTTVGVCGDATGFAPVALMPHERGFKDELAGVLEGTDLLLTFNGIQFDIPFLRAQSGLERLPIPPFHVDLRFAFAAAGIKGGLKRVQVQMGYEREGALAEVDGFMAVLLWQEHLRSTPMAIETLVRYCLEDVVVLLDLAPLAYDLLARSLARPWQAPKGPAVSLSHLPFDPALIHRLKSRTNVRQYYPRQGQRRW